MGGGRRNAIAIAFCILYVAQYSDTFVSSDHHQIITSRLVLHSIELNGNKSRVVVVVVLFSTLVSVLPFSYSSVRISLFNYWLNVQALDGVNLESQVFFLKYKLSAHNTLYV